MPHLESPSGLPCAPGQSWGHNWGGVTLTGCGSPPTHRQPEPRTHSHTVPSLAILRVVSSVRCCWAGVLDSLHVVDAGVNPPCDPNSGRSVHWPGVTHALPLHTHTHTHAACVWGCFIVRCLLQSATGSRSTHTMLHTIGFYEPTPPWHICSEPFASHYDAGTIEIHRRKTRRARSPGTSNTNIITSVDLGPARDTAACALCRSTFWILLLRMFRDSATVHVFRCDLLVVRTRRRVEGSTISPIFVGDRWRAVAVCACALEQTLGGLAKQGRPRSGFRLCELAKENRFGTHAPRRDMVSAFHCAINGQTLPLPCPYVVRRVGL